MRTENWDKLLTVALSAALMIGVEAIAGQSTPVGRWMVFDDDTGKADAVIDIQEHQDGALYGWIDKILSEPEDAAPARCTACEGELKDAPILGMTIIRDMQREGEEWRGTIMDPKNGQIYNARMWLAEGGEKLQVRGYIGIPLFGRSQVWQRAD
jgi:uncharacterized protein (DUF2147 family)